MHHVLHGLLLLLVEGLVFVDQALYFLGSLLDLLDCLRPCDVDVDIDVAANSSNINVRRYGPANVTRLDAPSSVTFGGGGNGD